jgi:endogenous inhibitor of DNA gyrase (YacG/DUF329 family)
MKWLHDCSACAKTVERHESKSGRYFCDIKCKARWQKLQKPVSEKWLREKYIDEGLDCTQIGLLVKRDPKSVWNWLKDFGVPTRKRGDNPRVAFKKGQRSAFAGRKHSAKTRRIISNQKKLAGRCPALINGKHWMHVYNRKPASWRGGVSPERQAFYSSREWKIVAPVIWARDRRTCQRCGKVHDRSESFDIHHIVSFENKELRAEASNLILVCEKCHYWIHSRKNKNKLFIK